MPTVKGKKYPYTPAGKAAAKAAMGDKMSKTVSRNTREKPITMPRPDATFMGMASMPATAKSKKPAVTGTALARQKAAARGKASQNIGRGKRAR